MAQTRSPNESDSVIEEQSIEGENDRDSETLTSVSTSGSDTYEDSRSFSVSLALNIVCFILYGYAILYQNLDTQGALYNRVLDPRLQPYGLCKYLTYNSLLMQFISASLHLLASVFPKYRRARDIVFTALTYPIGSLVVYTFWLVWWTQGREQIYPIAIETYYPVWLNHVTHTMVAPINIAQAYLTYHHYPKKGSIITIIFLMIYNIYVLIIRFKSGAFVYPFLGRMSMVSFSIYLVSVLFSLLALYESGSFITKIFHSRKMRSHID